jgi:hypothetical protein
VILVSCSKKQEPNYDTNFNDKIISFAINNQEDRYIELPGLYEKKTDYIPDDKDENLVLAEKLKIRGFKVINSKRENHPLGGQQIVTLTLKKEDCQCEVSKIYYSTSNISEYVRSERIKCVRLN